MTDALVRAATAFRTADDMRRSMRDGYVPTLSRRLKAQRELGAALEGEGWRVWWLEACRTISHLNARRVSN